VLKIADYSRALAQARFWKKNVILKQHDVLSNKVIKQPVVLRHIF